MRAFLTRALPAAVLVLAAGTGGFFAYGHLLGDTPRMATASPPVPDRGRSPAPPPIPTDSAGRTAIPDTLPDVAFTDRRGATRHVSDWKGRPLLVNFWASWCAPCREEIPLLERLSRARGPDSVQVIGIAVDARPAVLDYAHRAAIQYPLLIGEQPGMQLVRALGMEAVFPFSVFVDARGRIVTLKIGKLRTDQVALILGRLTDLDRGRIDLATARQEISAGMAKLAVGDAQTAAGAHL